MDIVYEDSHIIVINKASGVSVQPDHIGDKSLAVLVAEYLKVELHEIYVVNRLDRPVGGLVVLAKDKLSASGINKQIQDKTFQKYYYAVALGVAPDEGRLEDYLVKIGRLNISKITHKENKNAKLAILSFEKIFQMEGQNPLSLLSVHLETGRHHQIRAQLSHMGYPIWGDRKYNNLRRYPVGSDIALFSYKLQFEHPIRQERLELELGIPDKVPFSHFARKIWYAP